MALSKEKQKLLDRLRTPRLRGKAGAFLVEGIRGSREFLHADQPLTPRFALISPRLGELNGGGALRDELLDSGISTEEISDEELRAASATENPQGVILVMEEPPAATRADEGWDPRRILLLDGIQDPGNVGTLVRGARAFGIDLVVALDGTADPWGPKAVRSSAGAMAHTPVVRMGWEEARGWMEELGIPILAASAEGKGVGSVGFPGGWALAVGNEGAGVRDAVRDAAHSLVSIPMAPGVDSLNVAAAGAVLLFALTDNSVAPGEA
jgi:TrmH family RNA methyltransferase